ncbi:MAG: thioredoxin-related protein [Planctomycetota bacterium]|jgi:thioredoxin-related protein
MIRIAIAVSLLLGLVIAQEKNQDIWMTDFAAATAKAKAEKKDLLLDFTGSDWCGWCTKLDAEVFAHADFQQAALKNFVLVKIDIRQNKSGMSKDLIAQNDALVFRFGITNFPTLLMMDSQTNVYDMLGYEKGGPGPFNEAMAAKRKQALGFKAALTMAAQKQGIERARAIDDGLSALPKTIMHLNFELMNQVVTLDGDGQAGLKPKYAELVTKIEESRLLQTASEELKALILPHIEKREGQLALAKLDAIIQKPKNVIQHQMALFFKANVIMDATKDRKAATAALEAGKALAPKSPIGQQIDQMLKALKAPGGK